jgi:hypothetical protein
MKKILGWLLVSAGLLCFGGPVFAADDAAAAALAKESETYCASTVNKERPTPPATVIAKVNEACALLEKEGPAAYPKFSGHGSAFIYEGTYTTVHTLADHVCLVHPIKYKMVGQSVMSFKDAKGKRFYMAEDALAVQKGEGWVEYYWPKPGTQDSTRKITFIKKCKMADGVEVVVCSGFYSFDEAEIAKLEIH